MWSLLASVTRTQGSSRTTVARNGPPVGQDGKCEIERSSLERVEQIEVAERLGDLELDVRKGVSEAAHDLRKQSSLDALERSDSKGAHRSSGERVDVGLGRPQARLDRGHVSEQRPSRLRGSERSPAVLASDDPRADDSLEARDLLAYR